MIGPTTHVYENCAKKHVEIVSFDTKPLVFVKPIVDKNGSHSMKHLFKPIVTILFTQVLDC